MCGNLDRTAGRLGISRSSETLPVQASSRASSRSQTGATSLRKFCVGWISSTLRLIRCGFRASIDNIRLWNVAEVSEFDRKVKSGVQFKIIAGHHGGFISQMSAYNFGSPLDLFSYLGSQSLTPGPASS